MTVIKSHLLLATLFAALIGTTLAVSATCSQAGPGGKAGGAISSGSGKSLTGMDLGSGR